MALLVQIHSRITDTNGDAVSGGVRYVYAAGTTTPSTIYSDVGLTTTQTNPVTADSGGKLARIFLPAGSYRILDKDGVGGTTLFDADNYVIEDQNGTKGDAVASAATITLGAGQYFHITGNTGPITDIDFASPQNGRWAILEFDSTPTITHNATTLKLPGASDITAAAGDTCCIIQDSGDNIRMAWYQRAASLTTVSAASTTETLTGTDATKYLTADGLAALWEKGSDVASAATVTFGEGGYFHITGTTTITDFDWTTAKNGRWAWVVFDDALTLTHNATTLVLPGGANITTAANDRALFVQDAGDNVVCLAYIKADGTAVAEATAAHYRANTANKVLTTDIVWSAADEVTLTDAATIAVDMSTFINATVTLAGNRVLGSPTNEKVGQSGIIRIVQDGTGTRTLSYGTDWEFAGGSAPVLSTAAAAQDALFYHVIATDRILASLTKAIS
jgi:hypothetical protein